MSELVFQDCKLYMGGYDLSGDHNAMGLSSKAEIKDKTAFGATARQRMAGLVDFDISGQGYFEGGAGLVDEVLHGKLALADEITTMCPTTGAVGEVAYLLKVLAAEYKPFGSGAVGEMLEFDLAAQGSSGVPPVRGQVLATGAKTVTGNGAAVQLGAVASGKKLYAALHVLAVSGTDTPTVTVTIESSADQAFTTPNQRASFTAATAIGAEWIVPVDGPITDEYWRAVWTISGTTPSITLAVAAGIR